jgi:hypothetical protein
VSAPAGLSILASTVAFLGGFGTTLQILSPFVGLAWPSSPRPSSPGRPMAATTWPAKPGGLPPGQTEIRCTICENSFERRDMALCPAYSGPICSLCCTLEARCHDVCKEDSRFVQQLALALRWLLPSSWAAGLYTRAGQFVGLLFCFTLAIGLLLSLIYHSTRRGPTARSGTSSAPTLWVVFLSLLVVLGCRRLAHRARP